MEMRTLGDTGMTVSRLGLGLAEISRFQVSERDLDDSAEVLNSALDGGINFLDTAACYNDTEELIGDAVSHRRNEYILATKCGHTVGGASGREWSSSVIEDSIDRSLKRLQTDYLDLVQLHSCSLHILQQGEAIETLEKAKKAGKTRFIGYSGDNKDARWAVDSGYFDTLQTSYNIVDQCARTEDLFEAARRNRLGVIIKRPVANGVWGLSTSPWSYADEYFRRAQIMKSIGDIDNEPADPLVTAMGFVLARPEVDTVIVGTHNPAHLLGNIDIMATDIPIPVNVVEDLYSRFDQNGIDWTQLM